MTQLPWYPTYAADLLDLGDGMTDAALSVYVKLHAAIWQHGPLLLDEMPKRTRTHKNKWVRVWPALRPYFVVLADGRWTDERLEAHREKAEATSEVRRGAALAKHSKAAAKPNPPPKYPTISPTIYPTICEPKPLKRLDSSDANALPCTKYKERIASRRVADAPTVTAPPDQPAALADSVHFPGVKVRPSGPAAADPPTGVYQPSEVRTTPPPQFSDERQAAAATLHSGETDLDVRTDADVEVRTPRPSVEFQQLEAALISLQTSISERGVEGDLAVQQADNVAVLQIPAVPLSAPAKTLEADRPRPWHDGLAIYMRLSGNQEDTARRHIGKARKAAGNDDVLLMAVLREAERLQPANPLGWILAATAERRSAIGLEEDAA